MIQNYTVVDLEMTGLNVKTDKVIEIGAVKVEGGSVVDTYSCFLHIEREISAQVTELTGITNEMLETGVSEDEGMEGLLSFIGEDVLVGQNFSFDYSFIRQWAVNKKRKVNNPYLDTLKMARLALPKEQKKSLEALCEYFGIERVHGHRALEDAAMTHQVYQALLSLLPEDSEVLVPKAMDFRVKKISPITRAQVEQIKKYREVHNVTEPIDWNQLNRSEASRLMERYYKQYGRP